MPGNGTHFVLAGLSIPISYWRAADRQISLILSAYGLENEELHTAWIARKYLEQSKIPNFEKLDWGARKSAVLRYRTAELLRLQKLPTSKPYRQAKKNYQHTEPYVHLTYDERMAALREVAAAVSGWGHARLFAECIDKTHFDPSRTRRAVDEQAFEQVVSRFQQYLANITGTMFGAPAVAAGPNYGLLVHDNNQTVAKKHTDLMRQFHAAGALWTAVDNIIETPLFVDSRLTRMVQIADLCSYSLRRFVENGDTDLFQRIFERADRFGGKAVGVRHYTNLGCQCEICEAHKRAA